MIVQLKIVNTPKSSLALCNNDGILQNDVCGVATQLVITFRKQCVSQ